jgi:hypothetical protein
MSASADVAAAFKRYTEKNPFWKRPIRSFCEKHAPAFSGDEEVEGKQGYPFRYSELFNEYTELLDKSIALFISKTKGASHAVVVTFVNRNDAR